MDKPPKKFKLTDSTNKVKRHTAGMDRLIRVIGEVVGEDWKLANVLVTDESSVSHFVGDESDLITLSERLGFRITPSDLLLDVVLRMPPAN